MIREYIEIKHARENNLKDISLKIPKHRITVFTGVSGSGKSSLVMDTIAAQSRRELNDTFSGFVQHYLPKYGRPDVGRIENLPVAIVIDQKKPSPNQRSTVGTYTDTYTLLRLLFSRVGEPFVGYSDKFSFNHPQGSCPRCDGIGEVTELDIHKLVDFDKSLNESGVINYVAFELGQWRWLRYAYSGLFDLDKKIKDYSPEELELFLYSPQIKLQNPGKGWPKTAKYEGLVHRMYRSVLNSEEGKRHRDILDPMTRRGICPECGGARLNKEVLSCRINGLNIAEAASLPLGELLDWLNIIDSPVARDIQSTLGTRIRALMNIGLDYLTLDRGLGTLSGGEAQRCKIAKYMNSSLSDVLYILDEPSVGLHDHDIHRLTEAVQALAAKGNTVMIVEHNRAIIELAEHIVDMGPGAGASGGRVLYEGTYEGLLQSGTATGNMLRAGRGTALKKDVRTPQRMYSLRDVNIHNLRNVSVDLPLGVMTVIAGVAGSGKSSLMEAFRQSLEDHPADTGDVPVIYISQKNIGASIRSTPATYVGAADEIRKVFAKRSGCRASLFSFNGEGKCPVCQGRGVVISKMAFMDSIETECEACGGMRYAKHVLDHKVDGYDIAQVMDFTVDHALEWFAGTPVETLLAPLAKVGVGYLHLNQSLSTLSGGELQRLKLASHLGSENGIFMIDEPTDGLHISDVKKIIDLFDELTEAGNSVFLIEHNLDVIAAADHIIELGPGAGKSGGRIIFEGTPEEMAASEESVTGKYLRG